MSHPINNWRYRRTEHNLYAEIVTDIAKRKLALLYSLTFISNTIDYLYPIILDSINVQLFSSLSTICTFSLLSFTRGNIYHQETSVILTLYRCFLT
jgi:hypothetical protein